MSRATRLSAVALAAVGVAVASFAVASPAAAADTMTAISTETTATETAPATDTDTAPTTDTAPPAETAPPVDTETAPPAESAPPAGTEIVPPAEAPPAAAVPATTPTRIATRARLTTRQRTVHRGQRSWLTASVTYGASRVTSYRVYLQDRHKGHWRTIASKPLSSRGYATFAVKPQWSMAYRVVFPSGHGRLVGSTSATLVVRLTPWPASALRAKVVRAAARQVGKPYVFGAAGPRSFDCSGLTQYAFRQAGVKLAHQSTAQARRGRWVSRAAARPGDLVVFYSWGYAYHVAVYAGGGYIYEASNPGQPIGKHRLWSSAVSFRRLIG